MLGGIGYPAGNMADSILWWGDGAAHDGYWENTVHGFESRSIPQMAWSGTPFTVFDGAVMINVPDGPEQMFLDAGGDFIQSPAGPDGVDLGPA